MHLTPVEPHPWPIHYVAAGLPRPARFGHIALNYPNSGIGGSAAPATAKHQWGCLNPRGIYKGIPRRERKAHHVVASKWETSRKRVDDIARTGGADAMSG
jgi:hypothetical protein